MKIYRVTTNAPASLLDEAGLSRYTQHFTNISEANKYARKIQKTLPVAEATVIKLTLTKKQICEQLSAIPLFEFFNFEDNEERYSHNEEASCNYEL